MRTDYLELVRLMTLTLIGLVQLLIGTYLLLRGSLNSLFAFLLVSSLFLGSASVQLPALGGSSIQPSDFALIFVALRILAPSGGYAAALPEAFKEHAVLLLFVSYGVVSAFAAPRIFADAIDVAPMRLTDATDLFEAIPLAPTSQNITAAVYLIGTAISALVAHVVCTYRGGAHTLVRTAVIIAWGHGLIGLAGIAVQGTPAEVVLDVFRNASYAQLDHSYQGFIRLTGIAPEASSFASFGLAWFIFTAECWYRGVETRKTGRAAIFMACILIFSTSSTAYIGLVVYSLFFAIRVAAFPGVSPQTRVVQALGFMGGGTFLIAIAMVTIPELPAATWDMILHMTVDKRDSNSGLQRTYWAMQGWHAFLASGGLGIGPGSFRSSSQIMAIVGSMGVIGIVTFLLYVWQVFQPGRASTWAGYADPGLAVGAAAATTALIILIPAGFTAPSPNPGSGFAIFAGVALSLRPRRERKTMENSVSQDFSYASEASEVDRSHPSEQARRT